MNKFILIGVVLGLVVIGLVAYPSIRAPKAHEIVAQQAAKIKKQFAENDLGTLKISDHETDRQSSSFNVSWTLPKTLPGESVEMYEGAPIEVQTHVDVDLGALPSTQGYDTIRTQTQVPVLNELLTSMGMDKPLNLDCTTDAKFSGSETQCKTPKIVLNNPDKKIKAAETFTLSPLDMQVNVDQDEKTAAIDINYDKLAFVSLSQGKFLAQGIRLKSNGPLPSDTKKIMDIISGQGMLLGKSSNELTIDQLALASNSIKNTPELKGLKISTMSDTQDSNFSLDYKMNIESMTNVPMNITSTQYALNFENLDINAINELSAIDSNDPSLDAAVDGFKKLLAKGPVISQNFELMQENKQKTQLTSTISLAKDDNNSLDALAATTKQSLAEGTPPAALISDLQTYLMEKLKVEIDLNAHQNIVKAIAAAVNDRRAMGTPAANAPLAEKKKAVDASLAMLQVMQIVKKNGDNYVSQFKLADNKALLNGQDVMPILQMFNSQ